MCSFRPKCTPRSFCNPCGTMMCGLTKALALLVLLFDLVKGGQWDWSPSIWWGGQWWRKHYDTELWCVVTENGELMHAGDLEWYESWGWDTPWPEQGRHSRATGGEAEEQACSPCGPQGLPAKGKGNEIIQALLQLQDALGMKNRWDSRSFRAQLRRTLRRLCEREKIPLPPWWEGGDLTTHQYKMRAHQFVNDLLDAKLRGVGGDGVTGEASQAAGPRTPRQACLSKATNRVLRRPSLT